MDKVFDDLNCILKEIVPENVNYVFKPKIEAEDTYQFILVVEDKDSEIFSNENNDGLINYVQDLFNSELYPLSKKIIIDLEVIEYYG